MKRLLLTCLALTVLSCTAATPTPGTPTPPVATLPASQDCVPASLDYLTQLLHLPPHSPTDWSRQCSLTSEGTDLEAIAPAWETLEPTTQLVCVYTVEPDPGDHSPFGNQIEALRTKGRYSPDEPIPAARPYLWVGLHETDPGHWAPHCAVIYFIGDHVRMVSPNSLSLSAGHTVAYAESWLLPYFLLHTIAVFDVIDDVEGTPLR